jgi:hypothetical protein
MYSSTYSKMPNRPVGRSSRRRALLLGTVVALGLVAVPATARASSHTGLASSFCSKVSSASVSAVVGHAVPAGSFFTHKIKATKANHEISAVVSSCTYGTATTVAAFAKEVILSLEVTSKPLTGAELQYALNQAEQLKMKFTPYSGLGMTALCYTITQSGISTQAMAAIAGKINYSAAIFTKTPAVRKLAALVRLAEKL